MINNQNIAALSEKVAALEAAIKNAGIELPSVTTDDNGKTLQVVAGKWDKGMIIPELPDVTASDNGKVLQVVEGAWATGDDIEETPIDISSSFVLNTTDFNDLSGTIKAFYDEKTKRVWGNISAYTAASQITTSQTYCTVSSPYRPTSQTTFAAMVRTDTNAMVPYYGSISTDGELKQAATNKSTGIYGYFEYYL